MVFLKAGAFLENDLVDRLGVHTHQQLLDAISIGIAVVTGVLLWRYHGFNSAWLFLGGAAVGIGAGLIGARPVRGRWSDGAPFPS